MKFLHKDIGQKRLRSSNNFSLFRNIFWNELMYFYLICSVFLFTSLHQLLDPIIDSFHCDASAHFPETYIFFEAKILFWFGNLLSLFLLQNFYLYLDQEAQIHKSFLGAQMVSLGKNPWSFFCKLSVSFSNMQGLTHIVLQALFWGQKDWFWAGTPSSFYGTSVSLIFTKKVSSLSGSSFNIQKRVRDYLLLTKIARTRNCLPLQSKQKKLERIQGWDYTLQ